MKHWIEKMAQGEQSSPKKILLEEMEITINSKGRESVMRIG